MADKLRYELRAVLFSGGLAASSAMGGNDTGEIKANSRGCDFSCSALHTISIAGVVFAGTTTVAVKVPLRTCFFPVFGNPSQPKNVRLDTFSRAASLDSSCKAWRAPSAIASFCAITASIGNLSEVESRSHEHTAL